MILFRCDICAEETRDFWNVEITRKRIQRNATETTVEKQANFDVCSVECERVAVSRILSVLVPIAKGERTP